MPSLPFISALLFLLTFTACNSATEQGNNAERSTTSIRYAAYNVACFRSEAGALAKDLSTGSDSQIQNVAAVIQQVRPDVLALMEFDFDPSGKLLDAFQQNYLGVAQAGGKPIHYPYALSIPSNTGIPCQMDYNNDGKIATPNDAYGFGRYEGQYAFSILSAYPIDQDQLRSFQYFRWADMPDVQQPVNEDGTPYYSAAEWADFRLSSKNHVDIPIRINEEHTIHTILAHPTPPVFDGKEDRNGLRNYDEIRLLRDYISGATYLVNDQGQKGGLQQGDLFVIMGDLNADPIDGDSKPGAINQLLDHALVHPVTATGSLVPASNGGKAHNKRKGDRGDPAHDTAFFGSRIDYVLPSKNLTPTASGVFWPAADEPLHDRVNNKKASDHLLVWVDIAAPPSDQQ